MTRPTFCPKTHPMQVLPPPQAPPTARVPHKSASFSPGPHPQGSIYLNDFARVVSSDHEAVNGILHFIDQVLLPPDVLYWKPDAAPLLRV